MDDKDIRPEGGYVEQNFTRKTYMGLPMWVIIAAVLALIAVAVYALWSPAASPSVMLKHIFSGNSTEESNSSDGAHGSAASGSPAPERIFENGYYVTIVYYDGKHFIPDEVTVDAGEAIRFVNTSNLAMRVGSRVENLSSVEYSAIAQPTAGGTGAEFELRLSKPGIWSYENLASRNDLQALGVVYVR